MSQQQFEEIIQLIKQSQANAMKAVNISHFSILRGRHIDFCQKALPYIKVGR